MNPIYTGKDVSYIDTKQAQRAGRTLRRRRGEAGRRSRRCTGRRYPDAALDKAWRQLIYGAHHDAITGTESDQVYLDLLAGWREAHDLAGGVHATRHSTPSATRSTRAGLRSRRAGLQPVVLVAHRRCVAARIDHGLVTRSATPVPSVPASGRRRLRFVARDVPSAGGQRAYRCGCRPSPVWTPARRVTIANAPIGSPSTRRAAAGSASRTRLASGRELIRAGAVGNEILVYDEYAEHPDFHEGPWHLLPTGGRWPAPAATRPPPCGSSTVRSRRGLVVTGAVDPASALHADADAVARAVAGGLPPGSTSSPAATTWCGCAGRSACPAGCRSTRWPTRSSGGGSHIPTSTARGPVDAGQPGLPLVRPGPTARVTLTARHGRAVGHRAIGVAEVVYPSGTSRRSGPARGGPGPRRGHRDLHDRRRARYGRLEIDSNLPDVRIAVGGPDRNAFTAEASAGAGRRTRTTPATGRHGVAAVWVRRALPREEGSPEPTRDLTGCRCPSWWSPARRTTPGGRRAGRRPGRRLGPRWRAASWPATGDAQDAGPSRCSTVAFPVRGDRRGRAAPVAAALLHRLADRRVDRPAAPDRARRLAVRAPALDPLVRVRRRRRRGRLAERDSTHGHDYNHPLTARLRDADAPDASPQAPRAEEGESAGAGAPRARSCSTRSNRGARRWPGQRGPGGPGPRSRRTDARGVRPSGPGPVRGPLAWTAGTQATSWRTPGHVAPTRTECWTSA